MLDWLIFPVPTRSYDSLSYPGEILWIPCRQQDQQGSTVTNHYPMLYLPNDCADSILLFFHGNGEDLGRNYHHCCVLREQFNVAVFAVEYPGYGIAPGSPSEKGVLQVASAAYDFILQKLEWAESEIIVMGRSIGTGPALYVSATHNPRGLILITPFTSIKHLMSDLAGRIIGLLVTQRFPNIELISKVKSRTLIVHGLNDRLIPHTHSDILYEACKSEKLLIKPQIMEHNTSLLLNPNWFVLPVVQFLDLAINGPLRRGIHRLPPSFFDPKKWCSKYKDHKASPITDPPRFITQPSSHYSSSSTGRDSRSDSVVSVGVPQSSSIGIPERKSEFSFTKKTQLRQRSNVYPSPSLSSSFSTDLSSDSEAGGSHLNYSPLQTNKTPVLHDNDVSPSFRVIPASNSSSFSSLWSSECSNASHIRRPSCARGKQASPSIVNPSEQPRPKSQSRLVRGAVYPPYTQEEIDFIAASLPGTPFPSTHALGSPPARTKVSKRFATEGGTGDSAFPPPMGPLALVKANSNSATHNILTINPPLPPPQAPSSSLKKNTSTRKLRSDWKNNSSSFLSSSSRMTPSAPPVSRSLFSQKTESEVEPPANFDSGFSSPKGSHLVSVDDILGSKFDNVLESLAVVASQHQSESFSSYSPSMRDNNCILCVQDSQIDSSSFNSLHPNLDKCGNSSLESLLLTSGGTLQDIKQLAGLATANTHSDSPLRTKRRLNNFKALLSTDEVQSLLALASEEAIKAANIPGCISWSAQDFSANQDEQKHNLPVMEELNQVDKTLSNKSRNSSFPSSTALSNPPSFQKPPRLPISRLCYTKMVLMPEYPSPSIFHSPPINFVHQAQPATVARISLPSAKPRGMQGDADDPLAPEDEAEIHHSVPQQDFDVCCAEGKDGEVDEWMSPVSCRVEEDMRPLREPANPDVVRELDELSEYCISTSQIPGGNSDSECSFIPKLVSEHFNEFSAEEEEDYQLEVMDIHFDFKSSHSSPERKGIRLLKEDGKENESYSHVYINKNDVDALEEEEEELLLDDGSPMLDLSDILKVVDTAVCQLKTVDNEANNKHIFNINQLHHVASASTLIDKNHQHNSVLRSIQDCEEDVNIHSISIEEQVLSKSSTRRICESVAIHMAPPPPHDETVSAAQATRTQKGCENEEEIGFVVRRGDQSTSHLLSQIGVIHRQDEKHDASIQPTILHLNKDYALKNYSNFLDPIMNGDNYIHPVEPVSPNVTALIKTTNLSVATPLSDGFKIHPERKKLSPVPPKNYFLAGSLPGIGFNVSTSAKESLLDPSSMREINITEEHQSNHSDTSNTYNAGESAGITEVANLLPININSRDNPNYEVISQGNAVNSNEQIKDENNISLNKHSIFSNAINITTFHRQTQSTSDHTDSFHNQEQAPTVGSVSTFPTSIFKLNQRFVHSENPTPVQKKCLTTDQAKMKLSRLAEALNARVGNAGSEIRGDKQVLEQKMTDSGLSISSGSSTFITKNKQN